MRGAVHFSAAILAGFGVACTSTVDLRIDQRKDLAGYCTWNFLSLGSGNVHAPLRDTRELNASLTRLVEQGLLERGFARATGRPDFFVSYFLEVRHEYVVMSETPAMEHLSSLHHSTSYDVQATERRLEKYELGDLKILFSDPDEQKVVWRGEFDGRFRGEFSPHLENAVSNLLDRLPASAAGAPDRAGSSGECVPRI